MRKLTSLLSVILLIVSCKKEEPTKNNCPGNVYITSADLLNCQYRTGSYWVTIDSVNLQIDSTYIHNFAYGFMGDFCTTYEHHQFLTLSSSPLEPTSYIVVADGFFKDFEGTVGTGVNIYDGYNSSLSLNETRFDSLFVYDQFYYNVLRTEVANDQTEGGKRSVYYVNSDYGFLKHEIYDGSALISKKILKSKQIVR